jgi:O-antigen ligase
MEEGNALDRYVYLLLILLAFVTVLSRSFEWGKFFAANVALTALLCFSLLSVVWSDFPFIALKRWFRDLGTYLAILVVLTDPRPFEASRTVLRRVCYLLIPLCILLIKYYPEMGKQYDSWTGQDYFVGATTSKNMLGVLCLFSGLFFLWDTLTRWGDRKKRRTVGIILVNAAFFTMTLWLLAMAGSATSTVCFALGCVIVVAAHSSAVRRHPALLTVSIPIGVSLYMLLEFGLGIDLIAVVAEMVGRKPDLTGRTNIWNVVLGAGTNPLLGAGYESFWLGPRLQWVWERAGMVNQAHNGFLEVYLNLGLIGLLLLGIFLVGSYRTISSKASAISGLGSLTLALWTVLLFYNFTESAFRTHLVWVAFLLGAITVSRRTHTRNEAAFEQQAPRDIPRRSAHPSPRDAAVGTILPRRPGWPR